MCAINSDAAPVAGTWIFYDSDGGTVATLNTSLAAHGRQAIAVNTQIASAELISYAVFSHFGNNVVGYTKFYQDGVMRGAVPAVKSSSDSTLFVPHVDNTSGWWTGIALVNTSSSFKQLAFTDCDSSAQAGISLAPGEHKSFTVAALFGDQPSVDVSAIRRAKITGTSGVIGLLLFGQNHEAGNELAGLSLSGQTQTEMVVPYNSFRIANEKWTGLAVFNPGGQTERIELSGYYVNGTSVVERASGFELTACESEAVVLSDSGHWYSGGDWYSISGPSYGVTAFELWGNDAQTKLAGVSCVGLERYSGVFPKLEKAEGAYTILALANPGDATATVTLTAYSDAGSAVATVSQGIPAKGLLLGTEDSIFVEQDVSQATYIGFSSDRAVAGMQLNETPSVMDGLPAM